MESLEISAKTVEEAIQRALEQLGVSREEIEVAIIREGKAGILGFGAEEAVVRVTPLSPIPQGELVEITKGVLQKLLALMGMDDVTVSQAQFVDEAAKEAASAIVLDVKGADPGVLIGRRGQTLLGLQYIVRLIVGHQTKNWIPIIIDVQGYKQRRYQALQLLAQRIAEQVKAKGTPFTLEPMPAYERRIIHLALADHTDVTTQSVGQGDLRKVVVLPKTQSSPSEKV